MVVAKAGVVAVADAAVGAWVCTLLKLVLWLRLWLWMVLKPTINFQLIQI